MEVKEVIISALNLLGRRDIVLKLSAGTTLDAEGQETVNVLLYCFNAVEDELARKYFPLTYNEQLSPENGKIYYKDFARPPVKIKRITADGESVKYKLEPLYVAVNAKNVEVEYEYAPLKKLMGEKSDFDRVVSENLIAAGIAAEFCLINGEIEESELWEKQYRNLIDGAQRVLPGGGTIPPRRWV